MELAILFLVIVAALIAMQTYLKRGIQGHLKGGIDSIGEQYDPQTAVSDMSVHHVSNESTDSNSWTVYDTATTRNYEVTRTQQTTYYDNTISNGYEIIPKP